MEVGLAWLYNKIKMKVRWYEVCLIVNCLLSVVNILKLEKEEKEVKSEE